MIFFSLNTERSEVLEFLNAEGDWMLSAAKQLNGRSAAWIIDNVRWLNFFFYKRSANELNSLHDNPY